eukprot:1705112-Prymnesium_polylepis.1
MSVSEGALEATLQQHARGSAAAASGAQRPDHPEGEARQAARLQDVIASVGDFVASASGVDGAEVPQARDPTVSLDPARFLAALAEAFGEAPPMPPAGATYAPRDGGGDFVDMGDDDGGDDEDDEDD